MNSIRFKLFIFFFFVSFHCFGQDTLKYCNNSYYVTNCYYFYKENKTANTGIFEKYMDADDGQRWYGIGKFRETKSEIILDSYKTIRTMYQHKSDGQIIKGNSVNDTTLINSLVFYKSKKGMIYLDFGGNKTIFLKSKNVLRPKYASN